MTLYFGRYCIGHTMEELEIDSSMVIHAGCKKSTKKHLPIDNVQYACSKYILLTVESLLMFVISQ